MLLNHNQPLANMVVGLCLLLLFFLVSIVNGLLVFLFINILVSKQILHYAGRFITGIDKSESTFHGHNACSKVWPSFWASVQSVFLLLCQCCKDLKILVCMAVFKYIGDHNHQPKKLKKPM